MKDRFGREINYLRISVTDRCDLRCRYCMPAEGIELIPMKDVLTFEEITQLAAVAVEKGVDKIRLTGGEPLVRRGIAKLVDMLSKIPGVKDLAMSTNAILLSRHAQDLAAAGLDRVNISLDTMRPEVFTHVTRGGDIRKVFEGIAAARRAGLTPIKLNCVVSKSSSEPNAREVYSYGQENGLEVRFIKQMNFAEGSFDIVEGGQGGDCPRCNRLRLSSDGLIRPCLFSDLGFSIRELGPAEAIERALAEKPKSGGKCSHNWIRAIGG
ncbi:MAG: radical SAM protein [Deltaproteobacteria bacterium]|nr:radical SAM protein [Deltaproteobacteria bacterium]